MIGGVLERRGVVVCGSAVSVGANAAWTSSAGGVEDSIMSVSSIAGDGEC